MVACSQKKSVQSAHRRSLMAAAALVATGVTGIIAPAHAQPAATGQTAETSLALDEIVVTARRRSESLQDVPLTVTSFSAEQLDLRGDADITTLQKSIPNLTLQVARGTNSTLIGFIRGIGQQDPLWGFEPGVGLYVDDVYVARPQGAVLDIFDIERIEVLRGPQGTLYGRNTVGGAVKYVTRRLTDDPEGKIRANIGSYGQRELVLAGSTPLGEKAKIGAAYATYDRDGYGKNLNTGADNYGKDAMAGRVSVELTPTENLFIRLSGDYADDNSNAKHGHRLIPIAGAPNLSNVYDTRAGIGSKNNVENTGFSGLVEYRLNDTWLLKSITAYREGETQTVIDFDSLPAPTLDIPAFYDDKQLSQELQAVVEAEKWQGVFGVYYMDAEASGAFDTIIGLANLTTLTSGSVKTKSLAFFGDASFDLTDDLKASFGARWTQDRKKGRVFRANYAGLYSPPFGGTARSPTLIRTDYPNATAPGEKNDDEFTYKASLTYAINGDVNVYASYCR